MGAGPLRRGFFSLVNMTVLHEPQLAESSDKEPEAPERQLTKVTGGSTAQKGQRPSLSHSRVSCPVGLTHIFSHHL